MSRPADQLPRVTHHDGVEVYAAWCEDCDSDQHTRWDHLPTLAEVESGTHDRAEAICKRCERIIRADQIDAFRAREPERLEKRLAELRASSAGRSS